MAQQQKLTRVPAQKGSAVLHAIALSILCVISYWLITHLLAHVFPVSRDDDLLGGMWAVVATVFVYRYSYQQSTGAALSRMAATSLSFALCFVYLLFFPSQVWGMAALIGIGALAMSVLDRPDDVITTGITTAVVMVVAAISPDHAWKQPILRLLDTIVGVAVGVAGALIGLKSPYSRRPRREIENTGQAIPSNTMSSGHRNNVDGEGPRNGFSAIFRN